MDERRIGIGIVGTGFGASVQLPGFLSLAGVSVIGITGRDGKKARQISTEHHLPHTFDSVEAMLACREIDLVSVTVPQAAHAEIVRAAIAAEKDVLCEKPFTLSAADGARLLLEAEAAGIVHAIDFEFRELPLWQRLKKECNAETIGRVTHASFAWMMNTWADPQRPWKWQCDRSQGGGILSAYGVHLFDLLEWIMGPVQGVTAQLGTAIPLRRDATGVERPVTSEDHATMELACAGNVPVTATLSTVAQNPTGLSATLHGEVGTLILESTRLLLKPLNGEPVVIATDEPVAGTDPRIRIFQRFAKRLVTAVRERDHSFRPSFRDGVRTQVIREAALRSATKHRPVDIARGEI